MTGIAATTDIRRPARTPCCTGVRILVALVCAPLLLVGARAERAVLQLNCQDPFAKPGEQLTVTLDQSSLPVSVVGFQAFLLFDPSMIGAEARDLFINSALYGITFRKTVSGGDVDLAAGVDLFHGQPPTNADGTAATLNFTAGVAEGTTRLTFRENNPPSRFTDSEGYEVSATLRELPMLVVDGTPPSVTCPPDIARRTDPGKDTAMIVVGNAAAADELSGVHTVVGTRSDGLALTDPYPIGITTVTWVATDRAGNSSSCAQTVRVFSQIYVAWDAAGANNGTSWQDAFTNIQSAVDLANACGGAEIWVKGGTYTGLGSDAVSDSFEAMDPNSVDILGEERDVYFTRSGQLRDCHMNIFYLTGSVTAAPSPAGYGNTSQRDSFGARTAGILAGRDDLLLFANHPTFPDLQISEEDLADAANRGSLHGMEIKVAADVPKWDYALAHLDDQAGACNKILWAVSGDDLHAVGAVGYTLNSVMVGAIPTAAQDPVYADRRKAFRDMIRRGSFVILPRNSKCGIPAYNLGSDGGSASSIQVMVDVHNLGGATAASIDFYGCDWQTGSAPGTLLFSKPVSPSGPASVTYFLTQTGEADGTPLTSEQKANIKYIRPVLVWTAVGQPYPAYFQPVRIRGDGAWWNGPNYTLAGGQGVIGPSPYPVGGTDTAETIYFNPHSHSTGSDGDASPASMRRKYWLNLGPLDPSKPRFDVITDHNIITPFSPPTRSVVTLKEGAYLYGGFAGVETSREQRDWTANPTVIDGRNQGRCVHADGLYWANRAAAVLDGFVFTRGRATNGNGGGVNNYEARPIIANCRFTDNRAAYGGALCNSSAPVVTNCSFRGNEAQSEIGCGGAVFNELYYSPQISYCEFRDSLAGRGGAVFNSATPTISNCTFVSNTAHGFSSDIVYVYKGAGGGISNYRCSPTIVSNVFKGNDAAYGAGIFCRTSFSRLLNNTFVGNDAAYGGAIALVENSSLTIANNLMAFNSSGVQKDAGSWATVRYNCAWQNASCNYCGFPSDPTGTNGNIGVDPKLTSVRCGNLHFEPDSPCRNAGSNGDAQPATDIDGQPRIQDGTVDIGADESDGTRWPTQMKVYYVSTSGDDANSGLSWQEPKRTVQAGIEAASRDSCSEVWVRAGTYNERITLRQDVFVYGGFVGNETSRDERPPFPRFEPDPYASILEPSGPGSVVSATTQGYLLNGIDGFTIRGGSGSGKGGVQCSMSSPLITNNRITANNCSGIYCNNYSSPKIEGNIITGNVASDGGGIYCNNRSSPTIVNNTISANRGGGITCLGYSSPTISGNTISGNTDGYAGGIKADGYCAPSITYNTITNNVGGTGPPNYGRGGGIYIVRQSTAAAATISNNTITGNSAYNGGGICVETSRPVITNNTISQNAATFGGGIYIADSSPTVIGNTISLNTAWSGGGITCTTATSKPSISNNVILRNTAAGNGGGIYCTSSAAPTVTGCLIARNTAAQKGGGLYCGTSASPTLTNNTLAYNGQTQAAGIYSTGSSPTISNCIVAFNGGLGISCLGGPIVLANNDVFGHITNYDGIAPGPGDISCDPVFVDTSADDFHITPASCCRNAGSNTAPALPATDMDGQFRIAEERVDIGADEYWPPSADVKRMPDGSTASLSGLVVSAAWPDFFYVEDDSRAWGIRVAKPGHGLSVGTRVQISGILKTNSDLERYLDASFAIAAGSGAVSPLSMRNGAVGGGDWFYDPLTGAGQKGVEHGWGVNNIGLLIRTWGWVRELDPGGAWFRIEDGSVGGGGQPIVVRVLRPQDATMPPIGSYVAVTGASSCYRDGGVVRRLIRTRTPADVQIVP